MKQQNKTNFRLTSMVTCDAQNQTNVAITLMAVIPALSVFYLGISTFSKTAQLPVSTKLAVLVINLTLAGIGFLILRKYPYNILKLRQYITEVANGTLPNKIILHDAQNSDDIKYIEDNFNLVLTEMRHRVAVAEEQLRVEHQLREIIEQQQQALLEAERHRVMIQTLGATCHHISQPATVLQLRMEFLQNLVTDKAEIKEINQCITAVQRISDIIHQLQQISEFRTVPYTQTEGVVDDEILAIGSAPLPSPT